MASPGLLGSPSCPSSWRWGGLGVRSSRQALDSPNVLQEDYLIVYLSICTVKKIIFMTSRIPLRKGSIKELPVLGRHFNIPHEDRRLGITGIQKQKKIVKLLCTRKHEQF